MRAKIDAENLRETNSRTAHLLSADTETVSPSVSPLPVVPPLKPSEALSLSDSCLSLAVTNPVSGCTVFITELVAAQPGIMLPKFPLNIDELTTVVRRLSGGFQIQTPPLNWNAAALVSSIGLSIQQDMGSN